MNLYDKFCVKSSGVKINLKKFSPDEKDYGCPDHEILKEKMAKYAKKLFDFQYKLYAENKQSLLIVLQALDAGGKDGTINNVLSAMNPQGCRSQSFKVPTPLEASHDFLWREHRVAPHHGEVVIFNRSHYEDVLAGRVHGHVRGKTLKKHLESINDFEKLLHNNNTTIVKFFLHISKEEQLKRFGSRLDDPAKHWKISDSDYREREYWDDYMEAFGEAIGVCSTEHAPWFVIPSNNKKFRNYAISKILVETFEKMNPALPPATVNIEEIRRLYHQDVQQQDSSQSNHSAHSLHSATKSLTKEDENRADEEAGNAPTCCDPSRNDCSCPPNQCDCSTKSEKCCKDKKKKNPGRKKT
ncbi:MAG: PPK2 family polyphosphate kinase [Thermoguttaceae bacterium]